MIQDMAQTGCFKSEKQLQYALQVIEQSLENFPMWENLRHLKIIKLFCILYSLILKQLCFGSRL